MVKREDFLIQKVVNLFYLKMHFKIILLDMGEEYNTKKVPKMLMVLLKLELMGKTNLYNSIIAQVHKFININSVF